MVVLVVEAGSPALRGRLTRWMLEIHPGVFVGKVSQRVREHLWNEVQRSTRRRGSAVIMYVRPGSEQGYGFETVGDPTRLQLDFDGLVLMRRAPVATRRKGAKSASDP